MKRSEIFFSAAQVPIDFAMFLLASSSVYYFRKLPIFEGLVSRVFTLSFHQYFRFTLLIAPLFIAVLAIDGLYRMRVTRKFWPEAFAVFKATALFLVLVIIAVFLKREWFSSRFIIVAGWMFVVLYIVIARFIIQRIQKWFLVNRGIGVHRVLLIGSNGKIARLRRLLERNKAIGYRVVDQMEVEFASITHIKEVRAQRGIDEIIVCDPTLVDAEQEKLLDYCQINNITYRYIPTTLQTSRFSLFIFNGEPMLEFEHTPLDGWGKVLKRSFDLIAGFILALLSSPVMVVVALLIKSGDSAGPVIYRNERIGENGRKFFVYKFRYMRWKYCVTKANPNYDEALAFERHLIEEKNTRKGGVVYKIKDDPRKTKVGAFIERFSIDELPQFWNVLRGDMSLVGPRPHQEREVEKYSEYHRRLLTIKPGITGMAQISGRSDLAFEDEYHLDVYYIENWSLWLDILICLRTVGALLRRRKNSR